MEKRIVYFPSPGVDNTDAALRLAKERAGELGLKTVVLASTRGFTAEKALEALEGFKLVVVGIERERFSRETAAKLKEKGLPVVFSREVSYRYPEEMKTAFRRLSQGVKVAVEDAVIACQAGFVEPGMDVVSIAGSSRGADTAIVINAAWDFPSVKVKEIICMPR
ncbi:MAG: pyruvate kinase alpha/beta domain-containing protein [Candidatus Bathyarchaeia archaeon]